MNYFELFELPMSLAIDQIHLNRQFILLQKKYHPDFYGQADEALQEEALAISANINKAFQTLKNQDATIRYVLEINNLLVEGEKYTLPPDFLMEVMELNELKMEGGSSATIKEKSAAILSEIQNDIAPLLSGEKVLGKDETAFSMIKDYYFKKKYLDRLLEE